MTGKKRRKIKGWGGKVEKTGKGKKEPPPAGLASETIGGTV
jgi:hypothetical protein